MNSMTLLSGADVQIRWDDSAKKWTATVMVGRISNTASADWPEVAIGRAIMLQSGMTESLLIKRLSEQGNE